MAVVPALAVDPARARRAPGRLVPVPVLEGRAYRPSAAPPQTATAPAIVPIGLSYEWTELRSRSL